MKKSIQSLLVLLGCALLAAYFGHHTLSGRYGLEAHSRMLERYALVEQRISGLEAVRIELKRDIALLNANPPDSDLTEEIAQSTLGFAYPGDQILMVVPTR